MRMRRWSCYKSSKQKMDRRRAKRKSPCQDFIYELNENDMSPEHPDVDVSEPNKKVFITESKDSLQVSDPNLESATVELDSSITEDDGVTVLDSTIESVITIESNTEDERKVLEESVIKVKDVSTTEMKTVDITITESNDKVEEVNENVTVLNTIVESTPPNDSTCPNNETFTENKTQDCTEDLNPVITVKFKNKTISDLYKIKIMKFFQNFVELEIDSHDELSVTVKRDEVLNPAEWVVLDETLCLKEINEIEEETTQKEAASKKSKKKKNKKTKELFEIDTTPSVNVNGPSTMYLSKFLIGTNDKEEPEEKISMQSCFNCEGNHTLADCTEPRDHARINAARRSFRQNKPSRYHLEDDQKYSHLQPGTISDNLRNALGLRKHQLPDYIYNMRRLGYPPGWLEEAKLVHSNLSVFGIEGKNVKQSMAKHGLDPEKIIDYPGFNMPLEKGMKDEYRHFNVLPFKTENFGKHLMIEYFDQKFAKESDNLETCDMDLDNNEDIADSDDSDAPPGVKNKPLDISKHEKTRESPSLNDLEQEKEKLLAALDDSNSNSKVEDEAKESKEEEEPVADTSSIRESKEADSSIDRLTPTRLENPSLNVVKTSIFGTPILKSSSPYSRLPNPDNFSKDVSPVINFENLPNSTGKYEQMTGILQKVRNTLKNLQNCKS